MDESIRIRKRRRPRLRTRLLIAAAALLAALTLCLAAVNGAVRAPVISFALEKARAMALSALNEAAICVLESGEISLPALEKTEEGGCLVITSDQALLNIAAAHITREAQRRMEALASGSTAVDLGTASGFVPLSGSGPRLEIRFSPLGSVSSDITASLRPAGINQSLFSVELRLSASVRVFIAGADRELEIESTVPLQRTVLVGQTPQVYTNVANEDDMLNLIPTELP